MSTLWTGNPAEISPLLDASMRVNRSDESTIEIMDHQIPLLLPQRKPDAARLHFLRRLRRLFDELRPYQALYLAGLSILESIIVAKGRLTRKGGNVDIFFESFIKIASYYNRHAVV